jgi:hypothetical protein
MRRYGIIIAICLLIVVNAVVLAGIAYNRSGEPVTTIMLTERELPLASYYQYTDRENTGLSLRLDWSRSEWQPRVFSLGKLRENEKADWFDKAKLEEIGFNCKLPVDDKGAELHYQKMLPRKTYAVLEYEGATFEAWVAREKRDLAFTEMKAQQGIVTQEALTNVRHEFDRQSRTHSRLFVIDVGNDSTALHKKYGKPDRHLILPATVRIEYCHPYKDETGKQERPYLTGVVIEILTDSLYVPKEHRVILEKLLRDRGQHKSDDYESRSPRERGPSYEVKIHVGKRAEPWIDSVRALVAETPK